MAATLVRGQCGSGSPVQDGGRLLPTWGGLPMRPHGRTRSFIAMSDGGRRPGPRCRDTSSGAPFTRDRKSGPGACAGLCRARSVRGRSLLLPLLVVLALSLGAQTAAADPVGQVSEFSSGLNAGSIPAGIAPGADGNLWFADAGTTPVIGRITPSDQITEFSNGLDAGSVPYGIAPGADGN